MHCADDSLAHARSLRQASGPLDQPVNRRPTLGLGCTSGDQQHAAERLAALDVTVGVGRLRERVRAVDHHVQLAAGHAIEQALDEGVCPARLDHHLRAEEDTGERAVLHGDRPHVGDVVIAPPPLASWTAARPTPPAPAWMSTVSPGCRPPNSNRQSWAVANSIGTPAASRTDSPSGSGHTDASGTLTNSACEPANIVATTGWPTDSLSTPSPTSRTTPAA